MTNPNFSLFKRLLSFKYAFDGLKVLFKEEHNARIHLFATCASITFSILLQISAYEWVAIVFSIGLVIASEAFNSAIENIADFVSPQHNEKIKKIKDLSAAAVLISAITAFVIGVIIFIPKLISLIKSVALE